MASLAKYSQILIISEVEVKDESDSRESDVEVVCDKATNGDVLEEPEPEGRTARVAEDALTEELSDEDEESYEGEDNDGEEESNDEGNNDVDAADDEEAEGGVEAEYDEEPENDEDAEYERSGNDEGGEYDEESGDGGGEEYDEESGDDGEADDDEDEENDEEAESDDEEEIIMQVQTKPSHNREETDTEEDINNILNELPPIEEFVSDEVKAEDTTCTSPKYSVKCGEVYLVPNNKFTLICAICSNCFEGFEPFGLHIQEHQNGIHSKHRRIEKDRHENIAEKSSDTSHEPKKLNNKMKKLRIRIRKIAMHKTGKELSRQSPKASAVSLLTPMKKKRSNSRFSYDKSKSVVHSCPHCNRTFALKSALSNHLNKCKDTIKKPNVCKYCDKKFRSRKAVNDHIKENHTGVKKFTCPYCPKLFYRRFHRQCHINTHTGDQSYKCPYCNLAYTSTTNLNVHIRKKHFQCSHCDKRFGTDNEKSKHERTRTCLKGFKCDICKENFCNQRQLKNHKKSHVKNPFSCKKCGIRFSYKINLNSHMQLHSNVKKYVCKLCKKSFLQRVDLYYHKKNNHKT